jgi:hypothetical protein
MTITVNFAEMTDDHYCEFCREKVAEKEKREALRQKFKVIIGKKD